MNPIRSTQGRPILALEPRWWVPSLGIALLALGVGAPSVLAQAPADEWRFLPPTSTGPAVGEHIPAFRAPDQNGHMQDFNSIKGPKGAAVYFMRSADW